MFTSLETSVLTMGGVGCSERFADEGNRKPGEQRFFSWSATSNQWDCLSGRPTLNLYQLLHHPPSTAGESSWPFFVIARKATETPLLASKN